jgi:two-component system sensor histidine kinase KdpD
MANTPERPSPEALLKQAEAEERRRHAGRLRIFLGFAAGVGKTYAMLEAGRERVAEGIDVVVAYIETHGRKETEALLAGLPVIPRKKVEYRGTTVEEMDLDAVLARRPAIALVDELAHTNAPGSRHNRRYQDVEELLAAGIDVSTTLNVQHIESFNDTVAQITGVKVRETVPDHVLETADEIKLVDLTPDELIERLHEGKVYVPDQATRAVEKFFRPGNLTALREMALRYLAGRVDTQMRSYMDAHAIAGPWPAGERVLVGVGPGMLAERLVRSGRRLAEGLDAEWIVLHVEQAGGQPLPDAERQHLDRALRLAEELGARTVTVAGSDVAEEVLRYARANNITKIIVGRPRRPWWKRLLWSSVADQVVKGCGAIDVYMISAAAAAAAPTAPTEPVERLTPRRYYVYSAMVVALVTLAGLLVQHTLAPANLTMLYLLGVVVVALRWGRWPAALAATLSVLAFDFFFVPPELTFAVSDTQYLLSFAGLLIVGLVIGGLASRTRDQADAARRREMSTAALQALSGELAAASDLDAILRAIERHVSATFSRQVAVFLQSPGGVEARMVSTGFPLDDSERAVATWVFDHGEPAGYGTETLAGANARYFPLRTARGITGVMGVRPTIPGDRLNPEQRQLMETFASQAAVAIERAQLAEQSREAHLSRETERLQTVILNAISHDLRTPLASIVGALSSLTEQEASLDDAAKRDLLETAQQEAQRLARLVSNLLDMTRLEAGAIALRREFFDVADLVGSTLAQLAEATRTREIVVDVPTDLPMVLIDFVPMTQALANLVDNAIKYSPPDSPVELWAAVEGSEVRITVADRGPGIPEVELARVFDKFYRIRRPGEPGGVGLGLAIAKGFVEAHGGRIWAEARPGGGTMVTIALAVAPLPKGTEKASDERTQAAYPGRR